VKIGGSVRIPANELEAIISAVPSLDEEVNAILID